MKSEKKQPIDIKGLEKLLKRDLRKIILETMQNLVTSMQYWVREVVKNKGYYVVK